VTSKRREAHRQALRQLLDHYGVLINEAEVTSLIAEILRLSDRFNPIPLLSVEDTPARSRLPELLDALEAKPDAVPDMELTQEQVDALCSKEGDEP
jgi:hypothetical protein